MHLDPFLKQNGISQSDFGAELVPQVTQGQVSQWCRGVTRVTLDYALQIDELSNHQVTPKDCADMYVEPHLRAVQPSQPEPSNIVFPDEAKREAAGPVMRGVPSVEQLAT